ncbi:fungal-specific transcription factor domain-containing protein [Xylaria nigripes]|nr:fungal-specific transcription factor domain-containing protein [Xylaria nigripes]
MSDEVNLENQKHITPTIQPRKRRQECSEQEKSRSKRAKYNTNACDACKKCKLKCNRDAGEKRSLPDAPDIASLREQVRSLGNQLKGLSQQLGLLLPASSPPARQPNPHNYSTTSSPQQHKPQQPLFVGHTQSAFSLDAAKSSLSRLGIPSDTVDPKSGSPSREPSSEPGSHILLSPDRLSMAIDPLLTISLPEICRLLSVFHEEIEALYPFIDSDELITVASNKLKEFSGQVEPLGSDLRLNSDLSEDKDINILKIAVAIAIVVEAKGRNRLSSKLIDSTDKKAAQGSSSFCISFPFTGLVVTMQQSIYYFQIDEDLLAWRTIGNAARMALEMGLHRRRSLMDNYQSAEDQEKAMRVFWCVYALDRRWSFGTGLSFALNDRDIDNELPEPGDDFAHLRCLIDYGRLCSKVWDALPPYGSPTTTIPLDQVQYLEFLVRNWRDSIPAHLQFHHPSLGLAPCNQPRILRRLCFMLYLRGNHLRILVHRHHVLSPSLVQADLRSARLVVDIAKDSIQVLVHLAETSDIYARQQASFNYFLLSALAVILSAVCNAPKTFSESCHESFSSAVELVRNFSYDSLASRRLWNSIRGLLPAVRSLGMKINPEALDNDQHNEQNNAVQHQRQIGLEQSNNPDQISAENENQAMPFAAAAEAGVTSIPNMFQMGEDLMGLFNAFGQTEPGTMMFDDPLSALGSNCMPTTFPMEISRRFQDLI